MRYVLQEWIGHVVCINEDDTFYSILNDETLGGTDEDITLKFSDVPEEQKHLIQKGAIFTIKIEKEVTDSTSIVNSVIEFMLPKKLTQKELDDIKKSASDMAKRLNWD